MVRYTNKSMISGIIRTMDIPGITQENFEKGMIAFKSHKLSIDDAFPELTKDQKEFISYGTLPYEWDEYNGNDYDMAMARWKDKTEFNVG